MTMKPYSVIAALSTVLVLMTSPVAAQDAGWKTSYELEAAGKYNEAINALDRVAANGPDAELKTIRRGWLYYLSGNFNDAIREYRLAIDRNGRSVDARLGLTLPLLAQKRWREAEQSARSALDIASNNYTALLRLAIAQEGERDWPAMLKTTTTLVSSYPTDATAYLYLARANAWLIKREEAVAAYAAVLARYPGNLEAKAYLEKK
jgi:tetratricopeptide (TPR) repeat protein